MPSSGMHIPTEAINQMPPQVAACIKEKMTALGTSELPREQMGQIMGMCLKQFGGAGVPLQNQQGMMPPGGMNPSGGEGMMPPPGDGMMRPQMMDGSQPPMMQQRIPMPPPTNMMPPSEMTPPPPPQAANFSQSLVAGAAMPFIILWNVLH